jgi:hypothetical protein
MYRRERKRLVNNELNNLGLGEKERQKERKEGRMELTRTFRAEYDCSPLRSFCHCERAFRDDMRQTP